MAGDVPGSLQRGKLPWREMFVIVLREGNSHGKRQNTESLLSMNNI